MGLANGFLCFGPATFISCAFILSQFAQKGCRFIKLGDGETSDLSGGVVLDGAIEYAGLFCWQASNGMEFLYRDNFQYSSEHELARKMALATTVMGATSWGAFFFAPCVRFPPPIWLLISLMLLATCITEGITFKFFDSDWCQAGADCRLATSSKCGISACVFWGISFIMTCGIFVETLSQHTHEQSAQDGGNEVTDEEDAQ